MIIRNPILAYSAASTGSNIDVDVGNAKGIMLLIDIPTAAGGTSPTLTVTISGYVDGTTDTFTILASAALAAGTTGVTVLQVYPGSLTTANLAANSIIPSKLNIAAVIGGTSPTVTANISLVTI